MVKVWCNLWFYMGDCVICEVDGYFCFVDCQKDVICCCGENILLYEVE